MDVSDVCRLLRHQCGVISRRQVIAVGGDDNLIERRLRRREWVRVFDGVYVDHTGTLTTDQRAWAAVLFSPPAALAGGDALRAHGLRGFDTARDTVAIVVPGTRKVAPPHGLDVTRLSGFDGQVQMHLSPPRMRLEFAAIQVAGSASDEDGAVAVLTDVCQSRRTQPTRLLDALDKTPRVRHRAVLKLVLADVSSGAFSALERRFLVRVERAHGLPTGSRQRRVLLGRRPYYRDVSYLGLDTEVELDGRLGHDKAMERWADLERDLVSAVKGCLTVRVGWLQVLEACRLAAALGALLAARGWRGRPRACGPDCGVAG